MIEVGVEAVEVLGPGLLNWAASRRMLAGEDVYRSAAMVLQAPPQLSAAERRRAIPSVKLALAVGAAAVLQSGHDARSLPAVFASSGADGETIAAVLSALALPNREVSPTRFHNSVHNAPSGYWGIATQSQQAVTSVSCHDASFAAGLLEAAVQAATGGRATLLVAYDLPYPDPLAVVRPLSAGFGVAMVLSPVVSGRAFARLRLCLAGAMDGDVSPCADAGLEALRRGNPAARSLPLLVMLAGQTTGCLRLALSHAVLAVEVCAC
jgi:hypothetical protein